MAFISFKRGALGHGDPTHGRTVHQLHYPSVLGAAIGVEGVMKLGS